MAVRQYIGARYVPRFLGTYDNTQIYEALDVVDNGSGTSYIAKQPTPAGTPLTNTTYWAVYGASSGAIINLQNQIDDINEKLERNILIIGNSFVNDGNCDALAALFNHAYKYYSGGAGFIDRSGHSTSFEDLLDTAIADASFDNDTITDIIFVSAYGDSGGITEMGYDTYLAGVKTALASIKSTIISSFPNCTHRMITLAECRNAASFVNYTYASVFAAHHMFKAISATYGFEYLGWSGWNMMFAGAGYFDVDDQHPIGDGIARLGQEIINAFMGHLVYETKHAGEFCPVKITAGADSGSGCYVWVTPDMITLQVRAITGIDTGAITLSSNDVFIDLSVLPIPIIAPLELNSRFQTALVETSGGVVDAYVTCDIKNNSNGIAQLVATSVAGSTISSSALFASQLLDVTYYI